MHARVPIIQDVLTLPRQTSEGPLNLVGLPRAGLREALIKAGTPKNQVNMRVGQVWQWIYEKGVRDFDLMTNLAKPYRADLKKHFVIETPEVVTKQVSNDGTRKYLMRIDGGHELETVYIPEEDRGTLCISSQVGCTLTCSFCHTGTQKLVRNLSTAEICGQVMLAMDELGEWPAGKPNRRLGAHRSYNVLETGQVVLRRRGRRVLEAPPLVVERRELAVDLGHARVVVLRRRGLDERRRQAHLLHLELDRAAQRAHLGSGRAEVDRRVDGAVAR